MNRIQQPPQGRFTVTITKAVESSKLGEAFALLAEIKG
jgi:hypothetical protein